MKNIVFIPNIDLGNNRNSSYRYSIKSNQDDQSPERRSKRNNEKNR